jgi:2-polyprenyl-3-methyl-5-hydroxy-6-metoxy-1,4-benzoquinol methylase
MIAIEICPVCKATEFRKFLTCRDHFLSSEDFTIVQCVACEFKFVNPRPEDSLLSKYYKSEDYISHSNTKKGLVNRIYHYVRARNHHSKYKHIRAFKPLGNILDIGCATGEFLDYFRKNGWEVSGIEPDENARNYAINTYGLAVYPENELASLPDQKYDVITLWHVLEHVPMLAERIKELYRLLEQDGLLVIAVPNSDSYDATDYGEFWAGYDVPRHLYHFNRKTLLQLMNSHGFEVQDIKPMLFDAYYVSLLSEKYRHGKNNFFRAFLTGWKSNRSARKNRQNYSSEIFFFKKAK